ncbi:MAG TPA: DUF302 domain-containing protein [Candidatus Acidoferrum sp.]|nr:DUF302 domain-containing protein [Candidatus Acidoferrum sp.]
MSVRTAQYTVEISHVIIETTKPFASVRIALEKLIPTIDSEIPALLANGLTDRLKQRLEAAPELSIFLQRDHGMLVGIYGVAQHAIQYEIGNPLTASMMTRYQLGAANYAPLRVTVFEDDRGGSRIEYDQPSSLFGQFRDERVLEVARRLDIALQRALYAAAE